MSAEVAPPVDYPLERLQLDELDARKWDLLEELREVELARAALLNVIRGRDAA